MPQFIGRYQIREEIAQGGMGVVYRVYDPNLEREVALKVLAVEVAPDEKQLERFRREYEAVARLQHPNVIKIHDASQHQGKPFFVQELVEGAAALAVLSWTELSSVSPVALDVVLEPSRWSGGGLSVWRSGSYVLTCVSFEGNASKDRGGGLALRSGVAVSLEDCAFAANTAPRGPGVFVGSGSALSLIGESELLKSRVARE